MLAISADAAAADAAAALAAAQLDSDSDDSADRLHEFVEEELRQQELARESRAAALITVAAADAATAIAAMQLDSNSLFDKISNDELALILMDIGDLGSLLAAALTCRRFRDAVRALCPLFASLLTAPAEVSSSMRFQKWATSVGCPEKLADHFDNCPDVPTGFLPNLLSFAAQRGSRQVALYALAHGCAWNGIAYYDGGLSATCAAVRCGNVDFVRWARRLDPPVIFTFELAVAVESRPWDLPFMQWLLDEGCQGYAAMQSAAFRDRRDLMEWLFERGWDIRADFEWETPSWEIFRWLVNDKGYRIREYTFVLRAVNADREQLRWMFANREFDVEDLTYYFQDFPLSRRESSFSSERFLDGDKWVQWEHFLASLRSAGIIDDARHELWLKFEPIED